MHYWFCMLDGLSVYSALLILTFIANMFPLIGSFVKERRGPVLLWQWLITIISCLSIFDKPTVTQQHGCLSAVAHSGSTSLFSQVSLAADLPQFPLTTRCYIYSYSNRHSIFSCLPRKFLHTITTNLLPHNLFSLQPLRVPFLSAAVTNCQVMQSITSSSIHRESAVDKHIEPSDPKGS